MVQVKETFTRKIKNELSLLPYEHDEERGVLAGFTRYSGAIGLLPELSLKMSSSSATISKFIFNCFKDVYSVHPKLSYTQELRLSKSLIYHIEVKEKVSEILEDLSISKEFVSLSPKKYMTEKYFRWFVIGTFLASGQVSDPKAGRYFAEMVFNKEDEANMVLKKLREFKGEETMDFKIIERRGKYVLYLKKSDQISVFLSFLGAVTMMFDFENSRLERDYFNNENRLTICTQANYSRALKTGEGNIEDIRILEDKIGKVYFNDKTRLVADLRIDHKDASYQELASLAMDKGLIVTKSGVAHIFSKFSEDAKKFK